jgi:hypothetical protein
MPADRYDLCLAWNWEYDADFAAILESTFSSRGLSLWQVTPANLAAAVEALTSAGTTFFAFLDRASEADPDFLRLVEWATAHSVFEVNSHERAMHAVNKASMHLEFITAGIHTPHTIILPPYSLFSDVSPLDLSPLGENFIVKPAHGGGGEGVVFQVSTVGQVLEARQACPQDYYLLQARITPVRLDGRPSWFRVLYCGGKVYPFWWDLTTHVYDLVEEGEEKRLGLAPLRSTALDIAAVCGLHLFSSEIALTASGHFVVVDYVNNPVDLRLQSAAPDGVPDRVVEEIAARLADLVLERRGASTR